jgi:hypothetical protein
MARLSSKSYGEKSTTTAVGTVLEAAVNDVILEEADRNTVMKAFGLVRPLLTTSTIVSKGTRIRPFLKCEGNVLFKTSNIRALQRAILRRRIEVENHGSKPVVFTAPHTLALQRDNNSDHKPEDFTGTLARRFAKICGGACITWTESERLRIRDGGTDPTNRDPNYLKDSELLENPWFAALRSLREFKVPLWDVEGAMKPCLHVDVHGMKDPPSHPVDVFIGTG